MTHRNKKGRLERNSSGKGNKDSMLENGGTSGTLGRREIGSRWNDRVVVENPMKEHNFLDFATNREVRPTQVRQR